MKKSRTELILDIGSASVGACVATFRKGEKIVMHHSERVAIQNDSGDAVGGIQTLTLQALKKALDRVAHTTHLDLVRVVFAAPWYASEIKVVLSESKKPLKITQATVSHALKTERLENSRNRRTGRHPLESVVSQIYVNGYLTTLDSAVQGTELKVHLYESEADSAFVQGVTELIKSAFPHIRISFQTFPFIAFSMLQATREEENFMILDIGGEITDCLIGDRGALSFMSSFPKGTRSFVREIAGAGSITDALSRLTLFTRGELSPEQTEAFSKVFRDASASWIKGYERVIELARESTPVPRTIFLMADKEALPWFEKIFSLRIPNSVVNTILVTPNFFEKYITLEKDTIHDPFLSVEALFASVNDGEISKI
ncbi:MAG: hypothetical protein KBC74_00260 [Candidatus Pacebacteria bacterium]|nr:hypothetical protein [Candidatus Paceibacterota bacterium]MBP9831945.1 hypothetical protein [Candidatus Paceibacterota bacterium]